jgi:hypothetical protein
MERSAASQLVTATRTLGAASSPRRDRSQSAAEPDTPHTTFEDNVRSDMPACFGAVAGKVWLRERVLFIGTQFSILYTSMYDSVLSGENCRGDLAILRDLLSGRGLGGVVVACAC